MKYNNLVIIRGGGDLATGVIQAFHRCRIPLLILEVARPTAIRTTVALSQAVYEGCASVEDITAQLITDLSEITDCHSRGMVPIYIDPQGTAIDALKPVAVVDAILAKKNLGTHRNLAPITIALGPGFEAGLDVDAVIETMRGHDLGRMLRSGRPQPNTGIPGIIGGKGALRVLHAPCDGEVAHHCAIGDVVKEGAPILKVGDVVMPAPFTGLVRGLLPAGYPAHPGMKIGDIDPRTDVDWHTISDKARTLGGSALVAYLQLLSERSHAK